MSILPENAGEVHGPGADLSAVIQDSSLSFAARGLYATLADRPDVQWNVGQLTDHSASEVWEVQGAIAELANRSLIESGGYGWRVAQGPEANA